MNKKELIERKKILQDEIKNIDKKIRKINQDERTKKRRRECYIYQERENGKTYSSIAKDYGISVERVRQLYEKAKRRKNMTKDDPSFSLLSNHLLWILKRSKIKTREQLIVLLNDSCGCAICSNGFGEITHGELDDFVGFETEIIGAGVWQEADCSFASRYYVLKKKSEIDEPSTSN